MHTSSDTGYKVGAKQEGQKPRACIYWAALIINDQFTPAETSISLSFFEMVTLFRAVLPYPLKPPPPARGLKYVQLQVNLFFLSVVLVPQFSTELKENPGIFETERQARYAGVIGTRAIFKPRSFAVEDPEIVCDNNADTIATIYRDGFLAHRPMRPTAPRDSTKYRMTLIRSICIDHSPESFP